MKMKAWTNVDIECEVDVNLNDLLNHFLDECEKLDNDTRCARLAATLCGSTTIILDKMPDSAIDQMTSEAKLEMVKRLSRELSRYQMSLGLETVHQDQARLESRTIILGHTRYCDIDLRAAIDRGMEIQVDNRESDT